MASRASDADTTASLAGDRGPAAQAAWPLAGLAAELASQTEAERRLPEALVESIRDAGLFRMLVPAEIGGSEVHPLDMLHAVATLAEGDGSAGWCLAVAATSGMLAAYLPEREAEQVFGDPKSVAGGVFAPVGQSFSPAESDYKVTGRWRFASGCEHCDWLMGGFTVVHPVELPPSEGQDDQNEQAPRPHMLDSGSPEIRLALFPASSVEIHDTWNAVGLCGTGSHDISVTDLDVPAALTVSLVSGPPRVRTPLYSFPVFGLLALSIAAVGVGIARGALRELADLATAKRPQSSRRTLAQRPVIQSEVGSSVAKLRAARALVNSSVAEAWDAAAGGKELSVSHRVSLRLAATHAMRTAREVIQTVYELAGGSAVYQSSPLQRRLRDINVATQHMLVAPQSWELSGRILLGEPADTSQL